MKTQVTKLNFDGTRLYVGIDTHKKSWTVSLCTNDLTLKTFTQDPDPDLLVKHLKKNYPKAEYQCAYEAGFCGFWIQKALTAKGVDCIVVNPADVPTTNKELTQKTDPRDSKKIARSLKNQELKPIYIPSDYSIESRGIVRLYYDKVKNYTRYKNKVKGLINFYGIAYPKEFIHQGSHWSKAFYQWLTGIELSQDNGTWYFQFYIQDCLKARDQVTMALQKVKELSENQVYSKQVKLLRSIPGVGLITAMTIITELEDVNNRFSNLDQLCSYIGLIPSTRSSGEKESTGEMTTRGNKYLKKIIIECAWMVIRHDPAMLQTFKSLTSRMNANKAIVRIARKLLARIRYVLNNQQPYQIRKVI
jgi:transposase